MNPERFWGQPARYNMRDHENGYQSSLYQQYPYYHPPPICDIPSYNVQLHPSARRPRLSRTNRSHESYGCLNSRSHSVQSSNVPSFQAIPTESLFPSDYSWENGNNTPPVTATAESPGLSTDASDDDDIRGSDFTENESYDELLDLDEGLENPRGLAKQKIESLVSFKFNVDRHQGNQTSCVVCMFAFEPSQLIRRLPCSHEFHANCIDEWFQTKTSCPICRKNVSDCKTTSD
ncbi:hypothetical protein WA026_018817 [Henosepilachna vigintioctopunctata]|uniref:RING-type domain-containing protein n=1 Tax=Henosepilachna vigintioctopunctata TaxID=420089 RepID=A0AAW1TVF3_9CUCU